MAKASSFRVGKVTGYLRGRSWYLCYHEHGRRHRPRVGPDRTAARQLAAQINGQLVAGAPAALSFEPIAIPDLRARWLDHHEQVLRSSVQSINRYRTATDHLLRFLVRRPVRHAPPSGRAPDLGEWLAEIRQLEAEFGGVEVRWRDAVVRVVTDPVTLRDVALGPFAIEFGWDRVGHISASRCSDMIALESNPAAGRDEVPHPHVQGVELCAGDAAGPLERALADGRLADAFLIVRSVLTTYNPASAYVPLAEWDGVCCSDCGRRVDAEDRYSCEGCDADLCESCSGSCATCPAPRCGACLGSCDICRASCCRGCLQTAGSDREVCPECRAACALCSAVVQKDELTDGSRLCPACDPDEEDDADDGGGNDSAPVEVPTDVG